MTCKSESRTSQVERPRKILPIRMAGLIQIKLVRFIGIKLNQSGACQVLATEIQAARLILTHRSLRLFSGILQPFNPQRSVRSCASSLDAREKAYR